MIFYAAWRENAVYVEVCKRRNVLTTSPNDDKPIVAKQSGASSSPWVCLAIAFVAEQRGLFDRSSVGIIAVIFSSGVFVAPVRDNLRPAKITSVDRSTRTRAQSIDHSSEYSHQRGAPELNLAKKRPNPEADELELKPRRDALKY